ncbi:MAG: 3-oxoacyl-[acyl-carrier protein] reductase [Flavobacteriales bacterium]|jgi:3-oxoacyl-[acyl-carrier protein] reductase
MNDLNNKIVLITGAADQRGIGFACAKAMIEDGATVVITDLPNRQQEIDDAVVVLGEKARGLALDVTQEAQALAVAAQIKEELGPINILVNNAGIGIGAKSLMASTNAHWETSWKINVLGTVNCCRAVVPQMQANNGGVIINNSSVQGLKSLPAYGAYTTDKHALIGLTRTLAAELGPQNIRVVAMCPGIINTGMNDSQVEKLAADAGITKEKMEASMGKNSALNRIGQPDEVGRVAAFLASDNASYMNGNAVEISGGLMVGLN